MRNIFFNPFPQVLDGYPLNTGTWEEKVDRGIFIDNIRSQGYEVNIPGKFDLFLDLDTTKSIEEMPDKLDKLRRIFGVGLKVDQVTTSNSGNMHAYIVSDTAILNEPAQYAMQMFLGSDPVKEALSIQRYSVGITPACILIEGQWKN